MFYVYILQTKYNKEMYVGCTKDLSQRLKEHNSGRVTSTAHKVPYTLIHYEAFIDKKDAYNREKYLKTGWGKNFIKKNIQNYLLTKNLGG